MLFKALFVSFIAAVSCTAVSTSTAVVTVNTNGLAALLSPGATIVNNTLNAPRWSDFHAPTPGAVVTVATENDVLVTVKFCIAHNIPFLAQNGAHGWSTTINLAANGIIINLAGIKAVTFNSDNTQVTIQGGAIVSDVIAAANAVSALVTTGTCNCVGALGATLGAGFGYLMGQHGLAVDNLLSINLVTGTGTTITVTPADTELWFALRGAGPNFGIVTSAVMKAYPVPASGLQAFMGPLIFLGGISEIVEAMNNITLTSEMAMSLYFLGNGGSPIALVNLFYYGTEAAGRAAFAPIYALGPIADETAITPYTEWNAGNDVSCADGGRKPGWGVGLATMDPTTWTTIWNNFLAFAALPGAEDSNVLLDAYSQVAARSLPVSSSAYPWRSTFSFNAVVSPSWTNASFDATGVAYGNANRALLQSTSGVKGTATYINNAFGDESLQTIYGSNVARLQVTKGVIDPCNRFNQWFPLNGS